MPYIKTEARPGLDAVVNQIARAINETSEKHGVSPAACTNYVLCALFVRCVPRTYDTQSAFLASLSDAQSEIRRRWFSQYEDKKIEENGDISKV